MSNVWTTGINFIVVSFLQHSNKRPINMKIKKYSNEIKNSNSLQDVQQAKAYDRNFWILYNYGACY